MDFIEQIRVGEERAQARFGAEQNGPPAIFGAWIIGRIRIAEDSSTQSDKLLMFLEFGNRFRHSKFVGLIS